MSANLNHFQPKTPKKGQKQIDEENVSTLAFYRNIAGASLVCICVLFFNTNVRNSEKKNKLRKPHSTTRNNIRPCSRQMQFALFYFNPLQPVFAYLYPLKTSENLKVF